jgi:hypothetical protein
MGEPKATDIPEAAAADNISRFLASFWLSDLNGFMMIFAQQQAR